MTLPSEARNSVRRLSPTLNAVANDTGRVAYCGPYVISAITGYCISKIEAVIRDTRNLPAGSEAVVKGTYHEEVGAALGCFGYKMDLVASYMDRPRKERPNVWTWMQRPRNARAYYILAVNKRNEGHWILIRGVKLCDTYSRGEWQFVCDGPHRGAKIMEIFEVKKNLLG